MKLKKGIYASSKGKLRANIIFKNKCWRNRESIIAACLATGNYFKNWQ